MTEDLVQKWDKEHTRIPKDKSHSVCAEQTELEFKRNSKIADIGSGTGADAIYFLQHGHTVTAVDISPFALDQSSQKAASLGLQLDTKQAVLGQDPLPLGDNTLDGIYSRLALHYFDRKTTMAVLAEVYGKLKSGGKAFITIKSPDDKNEMEFLRKTAQEIEPGVFNDNGQIKSRFSIEQLKEMLAEAGLKSFEVGQYVEDLSGRVDVTKSGNQQLLLNEIKLTKIT